MPMSAVWLKQRAEELKASIAFCTRLPLPFAIGDGSIAAAAWAFPIAGIAVGLIGAMIDLLAQRCGLPPWPAATLCVAATLLATGCLHEDGLADTADGFGGGKTREQKLAIMRDSRIGSYGVCALAVVLLLRIGALASLPNAAAVISALIASQAAARATLPALMYLLPPARSDGLSFAAGRVSGPGVVAAAIIGYAVLAICLYPLRGSFALISLGIVVAVMALVGNRQIGGQTGDVLGALEQISEVAVLLVAVG